MTGKPCRCPGGYGSHITGCVFRAPLNCACTGGLCEHECHRGSPCTQCIGQNNKETKMSRKHFLSKQKNTQVFEKGVFRGEHTASKMDKEITSATKSYIRVPKRRSKGGGGRRGRS